MSELRWGVVLALFGCAAPQAPAPPAPAAAIEECHRLYLTAGSDGPPLLAVDAVIVDSTSTPPTRCGQLRSAHPAIKSSE